MAKEKVTIPADEIQKAKQYRDRAITATEFRKALAAILIGECGLDTYRTADILGTSRRTVRRDLLDIRSSNDFPAETKRVLMSPQEEREFLSKWENEAATTGLLTVAPIHSALVARLGRDVAFSTTCRILARHGWKKVRSNPNDPRSTFVWRPSIKVEE